MPSIKLEKGFVSLPNGQQQPVTTLELITRALESGGETGLSIKTILARTRLDRQLEKISPDQDTLTLTDDDFKTLQEAVEPIKWISNSGTIKRLVLDLFSPAEEAEVVTSELHAV
jgi:hypothetical protein